MSDDVPAYGLWSLVILNSAIFIFFAFSFFKPQTRRDWRSLGAFNAIISQGDSETCQQRPFAPTTPYSQQAERLQMSR